MNAYKSTAHASSPRVQPAGAAGPPTIGNARSTKISERHIEKLAIVYIRQSSPQQVVDHEESRLRQYALVDSLLLKGWNKERVIVIDEDQGQSGKSSEHRTGFQRLIGEVALDHVGIVVALEISRLSRSSKDWYHLLEICAVFGTLLADQDGVYDTNDVNDRLILGLKGTMSEVELFTMRNRLERGKLHKAERGELIASAPCGYLKLPAGEVVLDPDEQVRSTIQLIFDKFDELGSLGRLHRYLARNKIMVGFRVQNGPDRGRLEWRLPTSTILARILHHPIYAGAYSYGRRCTDQKRTHIALGKTRMREVPMSDWKVLLEDRHPAYITWRRYLTNQERLRQNRFLSTTIGAPRQGSAMLTGLLVCGACGLRMHAKYRNKSNSSYDCMRRYKEGSECCHLSSGFIDELVSKQVLLALEPAALELSLRAVEDLDRERKRSHDQWKLRLERAAYESQLAQRRYDAVEPENRLVARGLEKRWEEALRSQRSQEEEYDRFVKQQPPQLTNEERARVVALSGNIKALWTATETTDIDRKEIVRLLVNRVVVHAKADSEQAIVDIAWRGGSTTRHAVVRPVARFELLANHEQMIHRIISLRKEGLTIKQVAIRLTAEGYRTPRSRKAYTSTSIRTLLCRRGLTRTHATEGEPGENEWWLQDLAREVGMSGSKLHEWSLKGKVRARCHSERGWWVVWADKAEVRRLKQLGTESRKMRSGGKGRQEKA